MASKAATIEAPRFRVGDAVQARYEGDWYDGSILEGPGETGMYNVDFPIDNSTSWIPVEDLRKVDEFSDEASPPIETEVRRYDISREDLKNAVFAILDTDHDGRLKSEELKKLAVQVGFEGTDEQWSEEFYFVCEDMGCQVQDGLDIVAFRRFVDDQSDTGGYCTDTELIALLPRTLPVEDVGVKTSQQPSRIDGPKPSRDDVPKDESPSEQAAVLQIKWMQEITSMFSRIEKENADLKNAISLLEADKGNSSPQKTKELERALMARLSVSEERAEELERSNAMLLERISSSEQRMQELEQDNAGLQKYVQALESDQAQCRPPETRSGIDDAEALQRQIEKMELQKQAMYEEFQNMQVAMDRDLERLAMERREALAQAQEAHDAWNDLKTEKESLLQKNRELEEVLGMTRNTLTHAFNFEDQAMRKRNQHQNDMKLQKEQVELEKQTFQKELVEVDQLEAFMLKNIDRFGTNRQEELVEAQEAEAALRMKLQDCQDQRKQAEDAWKAEKAEKESLNQKLREYEPLMAASTGQNGQTVAQRSPQISPVAKRSPSQSLLQKIREREELSLARTSGENHLEVASDGLQSASHSYATSCDGGGSARLSHALSQVIKIQNSSPDLLIDGLGGDTKQRSTGTDSTTEISVTMSPSLSNNSSAVTKKVILPKTFRGRMLLRTVEPPAEEILCGMTSA